MHHPGHLVPFCAKECAVRHSLSLTLLHFLLRLVCTQHLENATTSLLTHSAGGGSQAEQHRNTQRIPVLSSLKSPPPVSKQSPRRSMPLSEQQKSDLRDTKQLLDEGILNQAEFDSQKTEILSSSGPTTSAITEKNTKATSRALPQGKEFGCFISHKVGK